MADVIDMIDKSLTDYTVSADAMRWSPEPPPAPAPALATVLARLSYSMSRLEVNGQGITRLLRPDPRHDEELRNQICRWLEVNGIDYNNVPMDARCGIDGQTIACAVYDRRDGKLYLDLMTRMPARRAVVVPLRVFPPRRVRAWLSYWDHIPGFPPHLAADGPSYRRRCLARRRRR